MAEQAEGVAEERKGTRERVAGRAAVVVPGGWLVLMMVLVLAPWIVVGALHLMRVPAAPAASAATVPAPSVAGASGPWGQLVRTPIAISPPIEYVSKDWGPVQPSVWHFPSLTGDELQSMLITFGISRDDAVRLRGTARSAAPVGGVVVFPEASFVKNMTPEVRARVYLALGRTALNDDSDALINFDQVSSYRYAGASADEWLGAPQISPATRALVDPLIYRHNGFMYFADIERVRGEIADPAELQFLAKRLLRQATLLVRLRVDAQADLERVVEYWGRGGRRTDLRPLLESVARGGGEDDALGLIDVSHLLPPIARQHLYRYPRPSVEDMQRPLLANCLWTALNFFNLEPDPRYLDPAFAMAALKSEYYLVQDNYQLGDIVAFSDARGNLFHVAVHLADDLLFSKNGTSPLSPWTILPFEHFKGHYVEYADDWRVTYHRRKDQ
jgi:hypothetical protein